MDPVYLDHAATTPLRPEVVDAMAPYARERFGNPSSLHAQGRIARAALEEARERVAGALGARRSEIRFVRGGTESDNLAVLGACRALRRSSGAPPPLAVSAIEHSAVLEAARHAQATGDALLTEVRVSASGEIDHEALASVAKDRRAVLSFMWVNNETGLCLPVEDVVDAARAWDAVVHSDAAQAVGKVSVDVSSVAVDLLSATGHKIGGPRGTGILFVRDGIDLEPLIHGGGQEGGLRPGTEDVAGAVGFASAFELAVSEQAETAQRFEALRARLEEAIDRRIEGVRINAADGPRAPHVSSIGFAGIEDGSLLLSALDLEGVAVSGGSACHSGAARSSHVIAALYGSDDAMTTVRYSFGKDTVQGDVDRAVDVTATVVSRLRATEDAA